LFPLTLAPKQNSIGFAVVFVELFPTTLERDFDLFHRLCLSGTMGDL
jgi:hypothetical protein